MKIIWTRTNDNLEIDVDNQDVVTYWFNQLTQDNKNCFSLFDPDSYYDKVTPAIDELKRCIDVVNKYLTRFGLDTFYLPTESPEYLKHTNLNALHRYWTYLASPEGKIGAFFSNMATDYLHDFLRINYWVHQLENRARTSYSCNKRYVTNPPPWQIPNMFGTDILKHGVWNVTIQYENVGKTYYDKWMTFDTDYPPHDTSNYDFLSGTMEFHLLRPFERPLPEAFIGYCNENQIKPVGNVLPIGNFKKPIDIVREIFYNNSKIQDNSIQIELN